MQPGLSLSSTNSGWLYFATALTLMTAGIIWLFKDLSTFVLLGTALLPLGGYLYYKKPQLISFALIFFALLAFEQETGTNIQEALYYGLLAGSVALIVPYLTLTGQLKLRQSIDKAYLVFFIFLIYGIFLGFLSGAMMKNRIDDMTILFPFFTYFIFRDHIKDDTTIRNILLLIVLMILLITLRNIRNYQQILLEAVMDWQIQKARVAKNEVFLMLGSVGFLIVYAFQTKWIPRLIYLGLFVIAFSGLILTQSRGYWLAFLVSMTLFFLFADRGVRFNIVITVVVMIIGAAFVAFTYYYSATMLIIENFTYRFSVTGGVAKLDASLLERVLEAQRVWERIVVNPFAGYGLGYTYPRYGIIYGYSTHTSYIHNGYLAIWFKLGLFGLLAILYYVFQLLKTNFQLLKRGTSPFTRQLAMILFCQVSGMMVVNITSPQFLGFDSVLLLTIIGAVTASMADRHQVLSSALRPDQKV